MKNIIILCRTCAPQHTKNMFINHSGAVNLMETSTSCVLKLYPSLSMFWALDGHIFHVRKNGLAKCYLLVLTFYNV
jgi:hypothetical protein